MESLYLGEWIEAAWIGRFLIALAFGSSLVSVASLIRGEYHWGKRAFQLHAWSVFAAIGLIFFLFASGGTFSWWRRLNTSRYWSSTRSRYSSYSSIRIFDNIN